MRFCLLISCIWGLSLIVMFPALSVSSEQLISTRQLGLRIKTIYIDPWYGGKQLGPRLPENKYGKEVTLEIAKKLKSQLELNGFNVYLSRYDDQFIPLEKRTIQSRQKGADIHLKIKVNKFKKDCINIFLPSLVSSKLPADPKTKDELNTELDRIVADLKVDDKIEESLVIANFITKKLKSRDSSACIQLLRNFDYVLLNTPMPAVAIEFGVLLPSKKQSYILDATFQEKIAKSLADAIKEYADERSPKMNP